jgi:hypothetical protein
LEKERLAKFFGEASVAVIERHLDDLEAYFGSAAVVIRMVMQGDNPEEEPIKRDVEDSGDHTS